MAGKASLLVIAGFSLLFLIISQNFGNLSTRAIDNSLEYYTGAVSHNIALSGANMAINETFLNKTWTTGYDDVPFQDGILNVSVEVIPAKEMRIIRSQGIFQRDTSIVEVTLTTRKFSEYAYYSVNEGSGIWWMARDTVFGPFHTEDYLRVSRHPAFWDKTTSRKKMIYYSSKSQDEPHFFGGGYYKYPVVDTLPWNAVEGLEVQADDEGLKFSGKDTVYLTFDRDTLRYKYSYNEKESAVYLPDSAANGVIYAKDCIVRLQGTVKGQYTLGVSTSGSSGKGTVWLDDNIVFDKDPRLYPSSTDLFGICAENNVWISQNSANGSDINIQASVYCEKGGFGAWNYGGRPPSGYINLLGGIIQRTRAAVGTFSGETITHGFAKRYRYDERLRIAAPPFFPSSADYKIVSWLE